jgi:hypothetical protein
MYGTLLSDFRFLFQHIFQTSSYRTGEECVCLCNERTSARVQCGVLQLFVRARESCKLGWNSWERERWKQGQLEWTKQGEREVMRCHSTLCPSHPISPYQQPYLPPHSCCLAAATLAWQPRRFREPNHAFCCGLPLWAPFLIWSHPENFDPNQ